MVSDERGGVVLQIELGPNRPSRIEIERRALEIEAQLRPLAVLAGIRCLEDFVEVAFVSRERFDAAVRDGPDAVRRLTPWGEEEAAVSAFA